MTTELYEQAELALASYANFELNLAGETSTDTETNRARLEAAGMSPAQIADFVARYTVIVAQYHDSTSGLDATVFRDAGGNITIAFRGVQFEMFNDLTTAADIGSAGAAYRQIVAMVNWWRRVSAQEGTEVQQYRLETYVGTVPEGAVVLHTDGLTSWVLEEADQVLAATGADNLSAALAADSDGLVDLVGYSLGGHLAMAFSSIFGSQSGQVTAFNAPGFIDSPVNQEFFEKLGGTIPDPDGLSIVNVAGDEALASDQPFNWIAGMWSRPGQDIDIAIEDQVGSDEEEPFGSLNHSMVVLTDSLAVYSLLDDLAPDLDDLQYKTILNQAAQGTAAGYERIVDTLRTLFKIDATPLEAGNQASRRDELYKAIYAVRESTYADKVGLLQITPTEDNASTLRLRAQAPGVEGLAYRYALSALAPFAVLGSESESLYLAHNPDGELDFFDPLARTGTLTKPAVPEDPAWFTDRADFLERKLYITGLDLNKHYEDLTIFPLAPPDQRGEAYQAEARHYEDRASEFIASTGDNPNSLEHFLFGREGSDDLRGAGRIDHLYGGGGTDYLEGKFDDDYLEGGRGMDLYAYSAPADDGKDTILDIDGKGVLRFTGPGGVHSVIAEASIKNSATEWTSADGKFVYTKTPNGTGGTDLVVTFPGVSGGSIRLKDWREGDFSIWLRDERTDPETTRLVGGTSDDDILYGERPTEPASPTLGGDFIDAGAGNDRILADQPGGAPDDGLGDADWILAGDGRDDVVAGAGNDLVVAGGDGVLDADIGGDLVYGGPGDDSLYGNLKLSPSDAINQGNSDNSLTDKGDALSGGAGDDWIFGAAARDALFGGGGNDLIIGGAGDDDIFGDLGEAAAVFAWSITRFDGGTIIQVTRDGFLTLDTSAAGADTIYAGRGNDWVFGGDGDDFIDGGADHDVLFGEGGSDILIGGAGDDRLIGDNFVTVEGVHGADYLDGGDGEDFLQGDGGDDILIGGRDNDILIGGAGKDIYVFAKGDGADDLFDDSTGPEGSVLVYGEGFDKSVLKIRPGSMILDFGDGDMTRLASFDQSDPDSAAAIESISFADGTRWSFADLLALGFTIDGTSGHDDGVTNPVIVGTAFFDTIRALEGNDEVQGREGDDHIDGGAGDDLLFGQDGNDTLVGGEGSDRLVGGPGNDALHGGAGRDALWGGEGDDFLDGGEGPDVLMGEAGNDAYVFSAGDQVFDYQGASTIVFGSGITADDLSLRRQVVNTLPVYSVGLNSAVLDSEKMFLSFGADELLAFFEFDDGTLLDYDQLLWATWVDQAWLVGGTGADSLVGYAGDDLVQGAEGDDFLSGNRGDDQLEGGDGNDLLDGGSGDDRLFGDAGDDILAGGAGDDTLVGGEGHDLYLVQAGAGQEVVRDEGTAGDFDIIRFEATRAEATLGRLANGDLLIQLADGGQVTVSGQYTGSANHVERLEFSDSVTVEAAELDALTVPEITGTAGDDVLVGSEFADVLRGEAGADVLDGGRGDDLLDGGTGADTYLLKFFRGSDRLVEDGVETSVIQLQAGMRFADLAVSAAGDDLVITVRDSQSAFVLTNYGLGQTSWVVKHDGGEQKTIAQLVDYLDNLAPPATVEDYRQQYIDSARRQYLTYLASFNATGDIVINEQAPSDDATIFKDLPHYESESGGMFFLNIGGITGGASANTVDLRSSGPAIVDAGGGADLIDNQGFGFSNSFPAVSIGSFLYGGEGNDSILGSWAADTLIGGSGGGVLAGSHGHDTYVVFATDLGSTRIDEVTTVNFGGGHTGQPGDADSPDTLVMVGIDFEDVTLSSGFWFVGGFPPQTYATAILTWGTGQSVEIVLPKADEPLLAQYPGHSYGVETIRFADGTVLTQDQLLAEISLSTSGTAGSDATVNGTEGDDTLSPPPPSSGPGGLQYFRTTLNGLGGSDILNGGPENDALYGGDGDDSLYGGNGADVLHGGAGNDLLAGGLGSDVYLFNQGDGQDTISDFEGVFGLATNVLRFGPGILPSHVGVTEDGGNLYLTLLNTGDQVTIQSAGPEGVAGWGVSQVEFEDATVWTRAQLLAFTAALPSSGFADIVSGTAGADTIQGQGGNDELIGRGGDDALAGDEGSDYLQGDEGNDSLSGGEGNDWLSGGAGDDTLTGGLGDDLLLGGDGADTYVYDLGDGVDTIADASAAGASNSVQFGAGIASEDLSLGLGSLLVRIGTSGGALHLQSFDPQNPFGPRDIDRFVFSDASELSYEDLLARGFDITGTAGGDDISGTAIVDRIRGGLGADVLSGGHGSDIYFYDIGDGADVIVEGDDGASTDVLRFGAGIESQALVVTRSGDDIVITLPTAGDEVALSGWFTVPGGAIERIEFADATFWTAAELEGRIDDGNDAPVLANPIADQLATEGEQWVFVVAADTFSDPDAGDILAYSASLSGGGALPAWLGFDGGTRTFTGTPPSDAEGLLGIRVTAMDPDEESVHDDFVLDIANVITGSSGADIITGTAFRDIISGNAGNDNIFGGDGDDVLDGGEGFDALSGEGGNDTLDPGPGLAFQLTNGGPGSDTYWIRRNRAAVQIVESADVDSPEGDTLLVDMDILPGDVSLSRTSLTTLGVSVAGSGGPTTIASYTVNAQFGGEGHGDGGIEWIRFLSDETVWDAETIFQMISTPTAGDDRLWGFDSANDALQGLGGNDHLHGLDGDDTLEGGAGDDVLYGEAGNDILDGGPGNDYLLGNAGNDTFLFGLGSGQDVIQEADADPSSIDAVELGAGIAPSGVTPSWYTGGGTNDLILSVDGTSDSIRVLGYFDDPEGMVDEFRFADSTVWTEATIGGFFPITGTSGADSLSGTNVSETLSGLGGNDVINAYGGNDWIDGGAGADSMSGGAGNDTYVIDSSGDQAIENANEGIDTVRSSLAWTLGSNLENLELTGSSNLNGTGNSLDNVLVGNSGRNTLTGGAGNDWLDGGSNRDTLKGGTGDDTYVVDHSSDSITENANEGIDTVRSSLAWTLGSNLENLVLTGTANINGTGNSLANVLTGNSGNNTLAGGAGNDTYQLGRGHGADVVQENDSTAGNTDIGQFLENIAPDQIWFLQSGSNLEVSVIGTPDRLTVQNWYSGSQYRLEQFRTWDGQTLLEAQVQNLVNAMAAFSPPPPGQETLPPDYATALNPVIAANWQ